MASSTKRTALVTGATGLLGREITAAFRHSPVWDVKGTGHSRADGVDVLKVNLEAEDMKELTAVIDEIKYVLLFSCVKRAAIFATDTCSCEDLMSLYTVSKRAASATLRHIPDHVVCISCRAEVP
jgi:dTDP-4-dehydrorhamnose reductase